MITLMNGTMLISSDYGIGTKVKVILDQKIAEVEDTEVSKYESTFDNIEVLSVDDSESGLKIIEKLDSETVGELIVKGPGVMTCYYKNEEATNECLKDGWLYTGDMAKYDEDGFIWLVDRKKDVIISGGENIYPVQIESFIMKNKKVAFIAQAGISVSFIYPGVYVLYGGSGCCLDIGEGRFLW